MPDCSSSLNVDLQDNVFARFQAVGDLAPWYAVPISVDLSGLHKLPILFHFEESWFIKEDVVHAVGLAGSDGSGGGGDHEVPVSVQFAKLVQGCVLAHSGWS